MVFDDFRDVDWCLLGTAKVSEMVPKGVSKWSQIGPKMVSNSVLKKVWFFDCFLELFWVPKWSQNVSKMIPKCSQSGLQAVKNGRWRKEAPIWFANWHFDPKMSQMRCPYGLPIHIFEPKLMSSGLSWAAPGCSCTLWDDILLFVRASRSLQVRFIKWRSGHHFSVSKSSKTQLKRKTCFDTVFGAILGLIFDYFGSTFGAIFVSY